MFGKGPFTVGRPGDPEATIRFLTMEAAQKFWQYLTIVSPEAVANGDFVIGGGPPNHGVWKETPDGWRQIERVVCASGISPMRHAAFKGAALSLCGRQVKDSMGDADSPSTIECSDCRAKV